MFLVCYSFGLFIILSRAQQEDRDPIPVLPSTQTYGPDGPWNAARIYVGNSSIWAVDLYPSTSGLTIIPTCQNPTTTCGHPNNESDPTSIYVEYNDAQNGVLFLDSISFDLPDLYPQYQAFNQGVIYRNPGSSFQGSFNSSISVGSLDLGSPVPNFKEIAKNETFTYSDPPNYLFAAGTIPSASFGLQIGSTLVGLPLSMWLGGYDSSRIIGEAMTLPTKMAAPNNGLSQQISGFELPLVDITVETTSGTSPWSSRGAGNVMPLEVQHSIISSGNPLNVSIEPSVPYIGLPSYACQILAGFLPVSLDTDLGLYIWHIDDPLYESLVTSPTFLVFKFGAAPEETIRVPFALLNLQLEPPLVSNQARYFPCYSLANSSVPYLGRAFLQASFIGANWKPNNPQDGVWWLAQAAGPNNPLSAAPTTILDSTNSISGYAGVSLEETWDNFLTPISGRFKGLYFGLPAIGVVCLIPCIVSTYFYCLKPWFYRKVLKGRTSMVVGNSYPELAGDFTQIAEIGTMPVVGAELDGDKTEIRESACQQLPVEVDVQRDILSELSARVASNRVLARMPAVRLKDVPAMFTGRSRSL